MGLQICGLTPKEHFRLKGSLPTDIQEKLIDENSDLIRLLYAANDVADNLETQVCINHDGFEARSVEMFLNCVRSLRTTLSGLK